MNRSRAVRQARNNHDLAVGGPLALLARDLHPMPRPHPVAGQLLPASLLGQVPRVRHLVELGHHRRGHRLRGDAVQQELPHPCEHVPDPGRLAYGVSPRPRIHQPAAHRALDARDHLRAELQPDDEQPQLLGGHPPVPARPYAPPQVQRDVPGVRTGRQFGLVSAEPHVPQEGVCLRDHGQVVVHHGPVADAGWELNRKGPQGSPPISVQRVATIATAPEMLEKTPGHTASATSHHTWRSPRERPPGARRRAGRR